jgi:hypothetical protein
MTLLLIINKQIINKIFQTILLVNWSFYKIIKEYYIYIFFKHNNIYNENF